MSGRVAVFAYGSLVSAASAAQTLGRAAEPTPLARLRGWTRQWSLARDNRASEKTFARPDGSLPAFCLGLDLTREAGASGPNGVLIELSEEELERLDVRELRYRRVEVSDSIATGAPLGRFDAILAYTARPEHHRIEPPDDAVVLASYVRAVESAFAERGIEQLELFRATTRPHGVELVDGLLIADAIPEGNPRAW